MGLLQHLYSSFTHVLAELSLVVPIEELNTRIAILLAIIAFLEIGLGLSTAAAAKSGILDYHSVNGQLLVLYTVPPCS
jgi:uncharacterized small protein (DUF1192 family)